MGVLKGTAAAAAGNMSSRSPVTRTTSGFTVSIVCAAADWMSDIAMAHASGSVPIGDAPPKRMAAPSGIPAIEGWSPCSRCMPVTKTVNAMPWARMDRQTGASIPTSARLDVMLST